MATALRSRLSYHRRLFLLLVTFSWVLTACFVLFQYGREKRFKAERLDARLQLFNLRMLDALDEGVAPAAFIARGNEPFGDLRVTLIDLSVESTTERAIMDRSSGMSSSFRGRISR